MMDIIYTSVGGQSILYLIINDIAFLFWICGCKQDTDFLRSRDKRVSVAQN